jgi:hypothetical protein
MIRFTLTCGFYEGSEKIIEKINNIEYFKSIKEDPKIAAELIEEYRFLSRIMKNGSFNDKLNNIIILFLTGSNKSLELIIECYGEQSDKLNYLRNQHDKIMSFLKEGFIFISIKSEEVRIYNTDLIYKNIKSIPLSTILLTLIILFGNVIYHFIINSQNFIASLLVFIIVMGLNFLVCIYYNKLGGKEYAYIPS